VQSDSESDDTLIRYLRGELGEAERDRVEEAYFADDKLHERLLRLEDRMIDSYVRGQLPPDERERFNRRVQNSAELRRKVEFAEALRRMVAQQASAPPRPSWWDAVRGFLSVRAPAARVALAAAAVVMLVATLVYSHYAKRAYTPGQQAAVSHPQHAVKSPDRAPGSAPQRTVPILAFSLSPLERGRGEENRVVIPTGEYTIRLRLDLEDGGIPGLSATVQTAEGARVDQLDGLDPQNIGPGRRAVFVSLPSSRFRDGQYVVRLSHRAADGTTELLGGYSFRVEHSRR
jgi:hypothetical protein